MTRKRAAGRATRRSTAVAATEAAKNFGRLVDQVREEGATYIIERHGRPIAQIGPVAAVPRRTLRDLAALMRNTPRLDDTVLRHIEDGISALNRPEVPRNAWER